MVQSGSFGLISLIFCICCLLNLLVADAKLERSFKVPLRLVNMLSHGPISYADAWEWQKRLMNHHILEQDNQESDGVCGTVLMLEHKSVYTLGTGTKEGSGPFTNQMADGTTLTYDLFNVERAGEATYHGPGQLVVYPILDLSYFEKDIDKYLRGIEQVVINSLEAVGIPGAGRIDGLTGVWVGDQKVAAIGIKLRRWVTMHGVSVNICPDMRYFNNIVPCGIKDKAVGSVVALRNAEITLPAFANVFLNKFTEQYNTQFKQKDMLEGDAAVQFIEKILSSPDLV